MSDTIINNPHDALFKNAMSNIRVAQEFFKHHLPAALQNRIDLNTLQYHKETFVDEKLKFSAADVVYSANIDNHFGYLYLLAEHQSTVDKAIPLRLLRYMSRLLEHHLKQCPADDLPVVYPCIFYTGKRPYYCSTDLFDLFGKNKALMLNIFTQPFQLIDIQKISDEEMREYLWEGIMEYIFKHRYPDRFMSIAESFMKWLQELEREGGFEYAKVMIHYTLNHLDGQNINDLLVIAKKHLSPKLGDDVMGTFAQQLIEQGMQRGMQRGEYKILLRQLNRKFQTLPNDILQRLETADEETLLLWADRVINAKSIEEIVGK